MIALAKICIELIAVILLLLALAVTRKENTKSVHYITIIITILTLTACFSWWFI